MVAAMVDPSFLLCCSLARVVFEPMERSRFFPAEDGNGIPIYPAESEKWRPTLTDHEGYHSKLKHAEAVFPGNFVRGLEFERG